MERDTSKDDLAGTIATRPNCRSSAPLVIDKNRPNLFGARQPRHNKPSSYSHTRSGSANLSPDPKAISPSSRIPRLHSNPPKPFTIKDAFKMVEEAEEKEAAQGSPSPAPRTWRSRMDNAERGDKSPSQNQGSRRRSARGGRAATSHALGATESPIGNAGADKHGGADSDSDLDHRIEQFGKQQSHERGGEQVSAVNGLFAQSTPASKVSDTGKQLLETASNGSLDGAAPSTGYRPWGVKAGNAAGYLRRAMSSPGRHGDMRVSQTDDAMSAPTPNKSFAWDADADFTAGDLLVSDSPPVKIGSTYRNTRIDEIRALEREAALKYPNEPPEPPDGKDPSNHRRRSGSAEVGSPSGPPIGRTNTKIDEIRAREIESLSRRAVATARLDEIRERNSEARSLSSSPELGRKPGRDAPFSLESRLSILRRDGDPEDGERLRREPSPAADKDDAGEASAPVESRAASRSTPRDPMSRAESHDLLRHLARAASTSPAPEHQVAKDPIKDSQDAVEVEKGNVARSSRKERNAERVHKAVGFAGLGREPSADSLSEAKSKRSSLALSDDDPTERIEREMQLFAPGDNHSSRAPSPMSDFEEENYEETPRPVRTDPLSQPTPKVTGAYVETPATVRPERPDKSLLPPAIIEPQEGTSDIPDIRDRKADASLRNPLQTSSAHCDRDRKPRARTLQRSRSLPRARSPLINSVRPPTVKDDLLEIQRTYQIEDSTLDDLDGMFAQDMAVDELKSEPIKVEVMQNQDSVTNQEIRRLGRSLESIRTARKGIERIENTVSKVQETKSPEAKALEAGHKVAAPNAETADPHPHVHTDHIASACSICMAQQSPSNAVAYIHVPVPRLWRRQPTFRLTLLGLVISALSLWYVAETATCAIYCKPERCYPGRSCSWSYDDPFWGYAIPVKLDQWTTGGRGRALVRKASPEVADWWADVWDVVTGTDIRTVDTTAYGWDARHQHRRRLRKRGLIKPFVPRPEDREKHAAWRRARLAQEAAEARREMGYSGYEEGETMAADERVR